MKLFALFFLLTLTSCQPENTRRTVSGNFSSDTAFFRVWNTADNNGTLDLREGNTEGTGFQGIVSGMKNGVPYACGNLFYMAAGSETSGKIFFDTDPASPCLSQGHTYSLIDDGLNICKSGTCRMYY